MDLTIRHKPGKNNSNTDALSRNPTIGGVEATAVGNPVGLDLAELQKKQGLDGDLITMVEYLEHSKLR